MCQLQKTNTYLFEVCVGLDMAEVFPEYLVNTVAEKIHSVKLVRCVLLLTSPLAIGTWCCHVKVF